MTAIPSVSRWFLSLIAIGVIALSTTASASAQYFQGPGFGFAFGFGPQITLGGPRPAWVSPPGWDSPYRAPPAFGPPLLFAPPAFGLPSRYMARRQAMMDRFASAYSLPGLIPLPISPYAAPYDPAPPYQIAPDGFAYEPSLPTLPVEPFVEPFATDTYPEFNNPEFNNPEFNNEAGAFAAATGRLTNALSRRENGDVWIEYLQCGRLADAAAAGQLPAGIDIRNLAAKYQGVIANPDLAWLMAADGFQETLAGLSAITNTGSEFEPPQSTPEPARSYSPQSDSTPSDSTPSDSAKDSGELFQPPGGVTTVAPESESAPRESQAEELPAPKPETQSL